jgi:hypothetical protein
VYSKGLRGFSTRLAHGSGRPRQRPSSAPPLQPSPATWPLSRLYAVVAQYPVADGYNTSKDFLNGYMELQVAGRGRIAFNDISGAPCSSWGVFVTYGTRVYTYYYEGAGQLTVNIATNGDLTLTTSNGKIVPKVPGQCT